MTRSAKPDAGAPATARDPFPGSVSPLLDISGLSVTFSTARGPVTGVHEVTLSLQAGQRLAIVGESGSGKSTTASAILRLLPRRSSIGGQVRFDGEDLATATLPRMIQLRGRQIGYVPQDPLSNLSPVKRVGRQLMEAAKIGNPGLSRDKLKSLAVEGLNRVGISDPERRFYQYPHEYSGGMRQRALIAMGMVCRPRLLIADEPTSALDVTVQRRVLDLIEDMIREDNTALLFITHDLALAAERADHIIVMQNGYIVERGTAASLLADPQQDYTRALIAAAPTIDSPRLILDRPSAAHPTAGDATGAAADDRPLISIQNVSKEFVVRSGTIGRSVHVKAVDGVTATVHPGETVALVGESGSGKSTTARMVLGLERPTTGTVEFHGQPLQRMDRTALMHYRANVQPVFQNPYASLDPRFTVGRSIAEPLEVHHRGSAAGRRSRVTELLELVALPPQFSTRYPHELSGGQRQRIAIARALALNPQVVVLDEAVSALDVIVQAQILELLAALQAELDLAYLFISHDLAVVRQVAHTVHVMQRGQVVESGMPDTIFRDPQDAYTRTLIDAIPSGQH